MRPTQVKTYAIRIAHENMDMTIMVAGGILAQFDIARRAEATILRGPHELESYLEVVGLLIGVAVFFSSNKNFKNNNGVLEYVHNLLSKSALMVEEFKQLMSTYSKPIEPDRLLDCLPKPQRASKADPEAGGGNSNHFEHPSKAWKLLFTGL